MPTGAPPLPFARDAVTPRARSVLLQLGGLVLGVGLLVLALRAVPLDEVGAALRQAQVGYLLLFAGAALLGHAIRAGRWQLLLVALHRADGSPARVGFGAAFASVMIGYMVNYAAPRLGEVARAANLAARARAPFSGVFGTVVIERALDVAVLAVCVGLSLLVGVRGLVQVAPLLEPVWAAAAELPVLALLLGTAGAVAVVAVLATAVRRMRRGVPRAAGASRLRAALVAFRDGLASAWRAPRRGTVLASTFAIWGCYYLLAYLPLPMLGIELGLAEAWVLLVVGSVGVAVPTPGGIGSYHYVTIQAMTRLYGVDPAAATAYAVLSHGLQLVLYCGVGFACLLAQGGGLRIRSSLEATSGPPPR